MKRSLVTLAVSVALLGVAGSANAGTKVGQWTGGIGAMWTATDDDRSVDDGIGLIYSFGYAMNEKWDMSFSLFSGNHDELTHPWDTEIRGYQIDFYRVYNRDSRYSPFINIGGGILDQHRTGAADKEVAVKVGGGLIGDITEFGNGSKLQFKLDAAVRNSVGRQITDFTVGAGLQIAFGGGG